MSGSTHESYFRLRSRACLACGGNELRFAMSAGGPRGRTTRRSLARLHADALLLHGSEEGATAGRTPDSAKVAAFDQPAGARIPWSITRPTEVDQVTAPGASPANAGPAEAGPSKLVDWNIESTISWLRESRLPGIEEHVFESTCIQGS